MPTLNSAEESIASLPELTCPICCDSFSQEHFPVSIDGYRHVFGVECLKAWVTSDRSAHDTCPTCRAVIFDISQPVRARQSVDTASTAPYQRVISDSDYEYETDSDSKYYDEFEQRLDDALDQEVESMRSMLDHIDHRYRQHQELMSQTWDELLHQREGLRGRLDAARGDDARQDLRNEQRERMQQRQLVRQQRRDQAYDALTLNIMFSVEPLLEQFLVYSVAQIVNEVAMEVQTQRWQKYQHQDL